MTELKQAASTALLASIVDSSIDAIVGKDLQGIVTSWNLGAERMFGYSAEEMIGQSILRLIPDNRRAEEQYILDEIRHGRLIESFDTERLRRDGKLLQVSVTISPIRNERGEVVGASKIARDVSQRHAYGAALRQARDTLLLLIEQAPVSIAMFDRDMRYVAVSKRWVAEYGGARTELTGLSHYDVVPDMTDAWRDVHRRGLAGEVVKNDDDVWHRHDGSVQWLRWAVHPWFDGAGIVGGIIIFVEDITARKESERLLHESEERFQRMFEWMLEGCQVIDFNWRYLYVNHSVATYWNATKASMIGRTIMEVFPGIEHTALFTTLRQSMTDRVPRHIQSDFAHRDGRIAWFDMSIQPCPEGIFVLSIDITERKLARERLIASEERYRRIVETAQEGIWQMDTEFRTVFVNQRMSEILGYSETEMIGRSSTDFIDQGTVERAIKLMERRRSGERDQYDMKFLRKDGSEVWLLMSCNPLSDAEGRFSGVLAMATDITERKRAQEMQLRTQKMEALGTLAGGIAHDFNNILLAIRGNTTLAINDTDADHPAKRSLLEIDKASRRATDLVRRILAFSRQEEPRREVVHLQPIIEEVLKLLRATLPAQIELNADYAADVPPVVADMTQIHQVLMNLATNAGHAIGDRPGRIDVSLHRASIDAEHVTTTLPEGRYVRVSVTDNGCGMDSATLERVFDPFFTTKPAGQGTGLGLSVVDGIMKSHGGAVTVYSERNRGSAFRLYFPESTTGVVPSLAASQPIAAASGERVLYVDDDEALVYLAERTLGRLGYRVTGCTNPSVALSMFRASPSAFDIVVTDLSMPVMPGFELARQLLAVRSDLPIVVTSGYVRSEDQELGARIGVKAIILKPNTVDELGGALDRVLRSSST